MGMSRIQLRSGKGERVCPIHPNAHGHAAGEGSASFLSLQRLQLIAVLPGLTCTQCLSCRLTLLSPMSWSVLSQSLIDKLRAFRSLVSEPELNSTFPHAPANQRPIAHRAVPFTHEHT